MGCTGGWVNAGLPWFSAGDLCGVVDCWDALTYVCVCSGQRCSEYCQNGGICELKPSGEASCRYVTKTLSCPLNCSRFFGEPKMVSSMALLELLEEFRSFLSSTEVFIL